MKFKIGDLFFFAPSKEIVRITTITQDNSFIWLEGINQMKGIRELKLGIYSEVLEIHLKHNKFYIKVNKYKKLKEIL